MKKKVMLMYLKGRNLICNAISDFVAKENGASDMIAVIVLIVIVIGVAVVFREGITDFVQKTVDSIKNFTY